MKRILLVSLLVFPFAMSSLALDKAELDMRIRKLQSKFEAMQANPEKRVPADKLEKARAVILLDRTKAGFIFAFQGGSGVAMAKTKGNAWSPPAFYKANEASLGFQIGGQQSFMVVLLMTTNSTRLLTESLVDVGGEASGTAGDSHASAEGKISTEPSVLVYGDQKGLYGGAALKGGAIEPDEKANLIYFGQDLSPNEILFGKKVKPSERAAELAKAITEQAKASK